ncbi:MAG: hypothetical protein EON57_13100 [Alphaproteobacteria bacterium]|nr:MAG: hypothetical protein EON57_13100 [Alphaproteobacteria bacterium]
MFVIGLGFGRRMEKGPIAAETELITFNTTMIILSSAIQQGPDGSGLWLSRMTQFTFACLFAIGMMSFVWRPQASRGN